jgi:hypothetical protein
MPIERINATEKQPRFTHRLTRDFPKHFAQKGDHVHILGELKISDVVMVEVAGGIKGLQVKHRDIEPISKIGD